VLEVPLGFAFIAVGFVGTIFIRGLAPGLNLLGSSLYSLSSSYTFAAIPSVYSLWGVSLSLPESDAIYISLLQVAWKASGGDRFGDDGGLRRIRNLQWFDRGCSGNHGYPVFFQRC